MAGWIHAVAPPPPPAPSSPPPPTTSPPPPSQPSAPPPLPKLGLADGKKDVRLTLGGVLGGRFNPAQNYTARCSRQSSTRLTCSIKFWHGPNDYYGSVTVYNIWSKFGGHAWTDIYTIHWANDQCYFHSGHPQQCKIRSRHGTW